MLNIIAYHGSNVRFNKFEQSKARVENDLYGGGVAYFTDKLSIAKSYANTMSRRYGGDKVVYEVNLYFRKIFDVDKTYTGGELVRMIGNDVEKFARSAKLLTLGADRISILSKLRTGNIELLGDIVFKGMSNGMMQTRAARERLISMGFDGLRHNGGLAMGGERHNVYLAYNASQINISKRFIVSPTPVESNETNDVYHFIN